MAHSQRQIWQVKKAGSLKQLQLREDQLDEPADDEVQVETAAVGLNFADIFAILGLYSATPKGSFVPGLEYAGTIVRKGSHVKGLEIGQKVMGMTRFGAYATKLNIQSSYVIPLPANWSFEQGASFLVQTLTAYYGLVVLGNMQKNDICLIHSAAGGVGMQALKIANALGAQTMGTVGREAKRDFLAEKGLLKKDLVIVRVKKQKEFQKQIDKVLSSLGADGFNIILDSVAGPFFQPGYAALQPMGRYVILGLADMMPTGKSPNFVSLLLKYLRRPRVDAIELISDNKSVMGFNLIWLWDKTEELAFYLNEINNLNLTPPDIGQSFSFVDAESALRFFQSGQSTGKVILKIDSQ